MYYQSTKKSILPKPGVLTSGSSISALTVAISLVSPFIKKLIELLPYFQNKS